MRSSERLFGKADFDQKLYKSNLLTLAKNCGIAVLIFSLLIFIKKIADTTYCGPPFFHVLRYLDISQSKAMNLNVMLFTSNFHLQNFKISCQTTNYQFFVKYYRYFLDTCTLSYRGIGCQMESILNGDLKMNMDKSWFPESPFWVGI